jgi:hypothetical protein
MRGESAHALAPIFPPIKPANRTRTSGLPGVMAGHLMKEAANSGGLSGGDRCA